MFDELNYFDYDVEEIEQKLKAYFKEMPNITDEQVEERADIGKEIFNLMLMLMFLAQGSSTVGMVQDIDYYTEMIQRRYTDIVDDKYGMDSYYSEHIDNFALQTVNTTLEHITDEYYTSQERALNIAENEANSIANYADYRKAVEAGKTGKKWLTQHDKKVRKTHNEVDGEIKPIDKPFIVGASLMMFPHDESLGADAKEIIHCRCHIDYLVQDEYVSKTNENKIHKNIYDKSMNNDIMDVNTPLKMNLQFFADPYIEENKLYNYLLNPENKHGKEFLDVGYNKDNAHQLEQDIVGSFDKDIVEETKQTEYGLQMSYHIILGITQKKRFNVVWQYDNGSDSPRLITSYREDK